jgi:cytoskeletal protein CcmA (bactofilin family)
MEEKTVSSIGADVEIVGTVTSGGSLHLAGKLDGTLTCGGDAALLEGSVMKGDVNAESVGLAGKIDGNVVARNRIAMKSSAVVNGDIKAKSLSVEDGVTFVGRCEVGPSVGV